MIERWTSTIALNIIKRLFETCNKQTDSVPTWTMWLKCVLPDFIRFGDCCWDLVAFGKGSPSRHKRSPWLTGSRVPREHGIDWPPRNQQIVKWIGAATLINDPPITKCLRLCWDCFFGDGNRNIPIVLFDVVIQIPDLRLRLSSFVNYFRQWQKLNRITVNAEKLLLSN